jgi:hypothetical protein
LLGAFKLPPKIGKEEKRERGKGERKELKETGGRECSF